MKDNTVKPRVMIKNIAVWCAYDAIAPIKDLKPHPKNPNKHPDEQIRVLAKIIKQNGFRESITVSRLSGFVIKGHGRLMASAELGLKQCPVVYQDYPDKKAEFEDLVADNQIAEMSYLDEAELKEIWDELEKLQPDIDLEIYGFFNDQQSPDNLPQNESIGKLFKVFEQGKGTDVVPASFQKKYPVTFIFNEEEFIIWQGVKKAVNKKDDKQALLKLINKEV